MARVWLASWTDDLNGSHLAITRYRIRLLLFRFALTAPRPTAVVGALFAIIGAWAAIRWVFNHLPIPHDAWGAGVTTGTVALGCAALIWFRTARRPQEIFAIAARTEAHTERVRRALNEGMRNERALDSLAGAYQPMVDELRAGPLPALEWPRDRNARACLVLTLAAPRTQSVDDVVSDSGTTRGQDWEEKVGRFAGERQSYMAALRKGAHHASAFDDESGSNVVTDSLTVVGGDVKILASTASYGQIVRTSDALINEFALMGFVASRSAFRRRPLPLAVPADRILRVLPWRREVHSWNPGADLVVAPRGRAAGLGVSVALIRPDATRTTALVARRSTRVGTYPGALHVIPSGMINTHGADITLDRLPGLTMMAEFLEECFDVGELRGNIAADYAAVVRSHIAAHNLGFLQPRFTGVAIDLLNLRTEICAVLDLGPDPAAIPGFTVSWEVDPTQPLQPVDADSGAAALERREYVQSGLGCLDLARQWLL